MRNRIRTREIGERFKVDGIQYEVVEALDEMRPCGDCAFREKDDCVAQIEKVGLCYSGMRRDDKQVFFKKTEGGGV